ncbi:pantetheine-phosphate adenylyltransferase [Planctomycetota bacterium]
MICLRTSGLRAPSGTKLGLLGSLYFSQGLPFGFFVQALPVVLRQQGYSLGEIGLVSLLALPWALKFLWAPAVDRFKLPRVGRRKSWIIPLQIGSIVVLVCLAAVSVETSLLTLMGATLLLNLLCATQDIATDGLAVDLLAPSERGLANGLQVAGYRLGMIAGGGVLLVCYEQLGSTVTFLSMAALTALASLPVVFARERPEPPRRTAQTRARVHFLRRPGVWRLLALVVTYKAGDAFATGMLRPFLADRGLSLADIGWLLGTVGFVAGLLGALLGGALVNRLGRKTSLVGFGLLQAGTVAGYALLAHAEPSMGFLRIVCGAEHFAGGMATAALFTCMMDWSSRESSATDYTVQASAVVIATGVASACSGFSADVLGYTQHFGLATAFALGSLLVVIRTFPSPQRQIPIAHRPENAPSCHLAVYAGTFDPVTYGHLSVVERASRLFDRVMVVVAVNPEKTPLFTLDERVAMLYEATADMANVECASTSGFVVDIARRHGAAVLVRGVRSCTDVGVEIALANLNHQLAPDLATVFIPARPDLSAVSSSWLKELVLRGEDVSCYCPPTVARRLRERLHGGSVADAKERHVHV